MPRAIIVVIPGAAESVSKLVMSFNGASSPKAQAERSRSGARQ